MYNLQNYVSKLSPLFRGAIWFFSEVSEIFDHGYGNTSLVPKTISSLYWEFLYWYIFYCETAHGVLSFFMYLSSEFIYEYRQPF